MSRFTKCCDNHVTFLVHTHHSNTSIVDSEAKPGLRRKLQSSAHKVTNDIAMADQNVHRILGLIRIGSVDVFSKRCLNSRAFDEKILEKSRLSFRFDMNTEKVLQRELGSIREKADRVHKVHLHGSSRRTGVLSLLETV